MYVLNKSYKLVVFPVGLNSDELFIELFEINEPINLNNLNEIKISFIALSESLLQLVNIVQVEILERINHQSVSIQL